MSVITVFGGSSSKPGSFEYDTAELIGNLLAHEGFGVATGAYDGVMEAALKGASQFGVERIGITTVFFENRVVNQFVKTEIKTQSYLDRLLKLLEIGDAYIVLPCGTGTLLELSAAWAFLERGIIRNKPVVCIGEQWLEVLQTLSFYSESALESTKYIKHVDNAVDAITFINEKLNPQKIDKQPKVLKEL
jgi:uncharacterized protein (TIGR00725 family)